MRPEYIIGIVILVLVGVGLYFLPAPRGDALGADVTALPQFKEIVNPAGFVNSEPFELADFVGKKVILLDFVTYSCINCQRTFPYLNDWYEKYKDQGFEIVGIHTPEFAFEKDIDNVRRAAKEFELEFPLVLDNDYGTWSAYENRYWPRKYLIDIHGNVVYDHIGEGGYEETESKIVELLNERKRFLGESGVVAMDPGEPVVEKTDFDAIRTPETYLGSARMQYLVNLPKTSCLSGSCSYSFGTGTPRGYELSGQWKIDGEYALLEKGEGAIRIAFTANKVNLVAGSAAGPVRVEVYVDGVLHKQAVINEHDLYNLVDLGGEYGSHVVEIRFLDPGVSAFAFTFG